MTWFTAGRHHFSQAENWPVISTDWKTIHIMPHNFPTQNPALTTQTRGSAGIGQRWQEALLHEGPARVGRRGPHFSGPSAGATLQG